MYIHSDVIQQEIMHRSLISTNYAPNRVLLEEVSFCGFCLGGQRGVLALSVLPTSALFYV